MENELLPFVSSRDLVADGPALRARFDEDGYLFLPGAVPRDLLLDLRARITAICAKHGWLKPGTDPADAINWTSPKFEGEDAFFAVYDEVQALEAFHALPHEPAITGVMRALLGPTAFPHPLSVCRLIFPDLPEWATPPHQDFPNNQGTRELHASWIPLGDCPVALGSLSVLAGSHRLGLLPRRFGLGAGGRRVVEDPRMEALNWRGGDFALGDMIVFHSLMLHRSEPNTLDRMRISVDYRFQREGDPIVESCLAPHFGRMAWDDIYRGWTRDDLRYYWRGKDLPRAEWDDTLNAERPEDYHAGIWARHLIDHKREQIDEYFAAGLRPHRPWRGRLCDQPSQSQDPADAAPVAASAAPD